MNYLEYYRNMSADDYIEDVKKNWFKMWEFWKGFLDSHDAEAFWESTGDYMVNESNFSFTFQHLRDILDRKSVV